jgi:hypothetical protein
MIPQVKGCFRLIVAGQRGAADSSCSTTTFEQSGRLTWGFAASTQAQDAVWTRKDAAIVVCGGAWRCLEVGPVTG